MTNPKPILAQCIDGFREICGDVDDGEFGWIEVGMYAGAKAVVDALLHVDGNPILTKLVLDKLNAEIAEQCADKGAMLALRKAASKEIG